MRGRVFVLFLIIYWGITESGSAQGFVKSAENNFEWRMIGRVLFDGGIFQSDSTKLGNGVVINDVRLGTVVRFLENWQGRIEVGYNDSKVSLKDIYVSYQQGNHLIKAGHYFELFGIENRVATTDYRMMTMSVTNMAFGDRRKLGLSYCYDNRPVTVSAGIFSDGDIDNGKGLDEGYTLTGKVVGRPVYDAEKLVHLGLSARFSAHDRAERKEWKYKAGIPTQVLNKDVNRFIGATVTEMINQWRGGADVILIYRGAYLQSECLVAHINRAGNRNYTGKGVYVQLGYLVFGNRQYRYLQSQGWVKNPDPRNLEILFRYNVTDLNDRSCEIMGGKEQDLSLGMNYYLNKYVALRLNYTYVQTDKYAVHGQEAFHFVQGRLQFSF